MYSNVGEVFQGAVDLSDDLERAGSVSGAREIRNIVRAFWTSSTEALGELRMALRRIDESATLQGELHDRLRELQDACTSLMGLS